MNKVNKTDMKKASGLMFSGAKTKESLIFTLMNPVTKK